MLQGSKSSFLWKITFPGQRRPRFPALSPGLAGKTLGGKMKEKYSPPIPSKLSVGLSPQTAPLELRVATSKTLKSNWAAARFAGAKLGESTLGTAASRLCFILCTVSFRASLASTSGSLMSAIYANTTRMSTDFIVTTLQGTDFYDLMVLG